jgi:hypothetical protein
MKRLISLALAFGLLGHSGLRLAAGAGCGAAKTCRLSYFSVDGLKNRDVLDMLKAGVPSEVIIARIKSAGSTLDTSTEALQELQAAGASAAVILAMLEASTGQQTEAARPITIRVPDNTTVEIENAFDVSSATVKEGDLITFRVLRPVKIDGVTVIEAGALANGRVVQAKKAGRWGRAGRLAIRIEDVIAVDGKALPLRAESSVKGEGNEAEVATKTAVSAALLAPTIILAPIALLNGFKRGENAVLPAGARFIAYVKGASTVTVAPKIQARP